MNFKEKYKKIKNFKKILNRPIFLFYLFIVIMLSNLGYSIYHNYNLHINYNYQPAKEYIDIDNLNISYQLFHIENNDQIIYDSDRIYSIINNKFQDQNKNFDLVSFQQIDNYKFLNKEDSYIVKDKSTNTIQYIEGFKYSKPYDKYEDIVDKSHFEDKFIKT